MTCCFFSALGFLSVGFWYSSGCVIYLPVCRREAIFAHRNKPEISSVMKNAQTFLVLCLTCCWGALAWGQGLSPADKFAAHTGSLDDPYLVENEADWNYLSQKSADNMWYKGKYIHLKADLNGQQLKVFEGLQGVFDGEGHTISNFHLDLKTDGVRDYKAGLFRILGSDATLRNLVVRGAKIVSTGARIEKSGVSIGLVVGSHAGVLDRVTLLESSIDILGSVDGAEYNETNVGALVGWGGTVRKYVIARRKTVLFAAGIRISALGGLRGHRVPPCITTSGAAP